MISIYRFIGYSLFFFALSAQALVDHIPHLLAQKDRPTMDQIRNISWEDAEDFLAGATEPDARERIAFQLYELVIGEMNKTPRNMPIFIFARDGEGLFDAIQAGGPSGLKNRVHLVNISRPVAATPDSNVVVKALRKMGMPIDEVGNCEEKMMWLDTGTRGSIYLNLLNHLFNQVPRMTTARQSYIKCLLENIDARLIVARSTEMAGQFQDYVRSSGDMEPSSLVSHMHSQLFFPEIPRVGRDTVGIPKGEHEKWQWIVQNIEYLPKWDGRAVGLTPHGDPIITVEPREASRINKDAYLRHQIKLFRHFSERRYDAKEEYEYVKPRHETPPPRKMASAPTKKIEFAEWLSVDKIKELSQLIRHEDDPDRYIKILAAIAHDPDGSLFLLNNLIESKKFAHVVYRHTDIFPKSFLKTYRLKINEIEEMGGSHERASEACRKLLGGK